MRHNEPPSVGAKDLRDLQGVSRSPAIAILQKQLVPATPRPAATAPPDFKLPTSVEGHATALANARRALFQALKQFSANDYLRWALEYLKFRFGESMIF